MSRRSGDGWPEKLSENLASCRVFVPLFSPRYFTSEMCGREWYAFNERILRARAVGAGSVPAIVPALWTHVGMAQLPDSVRHIHVVRKTEMTTVPAPVAAPTVIEKRTTTTTTSPTASPGTST